MSVSFLIKILSLHDRRGETKGKKETRREGLARKRRSGFMRERELLISYRRECLLPFGGEAGYTGEGKTVVVGWGLKLDRAEDEGRRGSTLCNPPPDLPAEIYRSFSTDPFPLSLSLSSPFNDNTRIFDAYSIVKAPPRSPRPCIRHTSSRSNYSLRLLEETNLYLSLQDFVFCYYSSSLFKKKK